MRKTEVGQWLRLHALNAEHTDSIPHQGTRSCMLHNVAPTPLPTPRPRKKKKKKRLSW